MLQLELYFVFCLEVDRILIGVVSGRYSRLR